MSSSLNLRQRDRLEVIDENDEERTVFGWATVKRVSIVRGSNPVVDHGQPILLGGDGIRDPDAVTHWVAEELEDEFYIDPTDHGVDVIDPTNEEVDVL